MGTPWTAWLALAGGILLEAGATTCMKLSDGYKGDLQWTIGFYVLYAASLSVLPFAMEHINMSTCYATWAGIGTALTTVIGVVGFKDHFNSQKAMAITGIIGCVVWLHLSDGDGGSAVLVPQQSEAEQAPLRHAGPT
jgi:multidrug transporter EmrE-like cation transporter